MPFKKGAFHVAVDSGLPILPVVMSEYDFLDHKKKRFGKGVINIQVTFSIIYLCAASFCSFF